VIVALLAIGTYIRFYFVSWVGERVSADLRDAVYARLIRLHPGFFEANTPMLENPDLIYPGQVLRIPALDA